MDFDRLLNIHYGQTHQRRQARMGMEMNLNANSSKFIVQLTCIITTPLTDRNQFVKIGEEWSFTRAITRSIVQGSGIGPTLFTICIIDLQPLDATNHICEYADDSVYLYQKSVI